jgi:hypothetical protein
LGFIFTPAIFMVAGPHQKLWCGTVPLSVFCILAIQSMRYLCFGPHLSYSISMKGYRSTALITHISSIIYTYIKDLGTNSCRVDLLVRFVKWLTKNRKLQGIPPSAFFSQEHKYIGEDYIRFCFIKVGSAHCTERVKGAQV